MKIFIDESGLFLKGKNEHSFSCIGALIIPSIKINKIYEHFKLISKNWPKNIEGEIKGKDLNTLQINEVAKILRKYDCLFELTAIDLNIESDEEHKAHKEIQILRIPAYEEVIRRRLENLSDQLYVQFCVLMQIVPRIIQHSLLYYARRKPSELAEFEWIIDAKNIEITSYEQLWKALICPVLQRRFLEKPIITINDKKFNYSYFNRSFPVTTIPEYLKPYLTSASEKDLFDVKKVMLNSLTFQQSKDVTGLQLIDIIVNGIRRLINNKSSVCSMQAIGSLMIHDNGKVIDFITLSSKKHLLPRHVIVLHSELLKLSRELLF